ncbi:hypothetical protein GCM10009738_64720 [Kitasatospora viridis]
MTSPTAPADSPTPPSASPPAQTPDGPPGAVAGQHNGGTGTVDNGPYPSRAADPSSAPGAPNGGMRPTFADPTPSASSS